MFCKNCGAKLKSKAKFCEECGWEVGSEVKKASKTEVASGFKIPVIPIIAVIGIIAVGFVVKTIFFGGSSLARQAKKVKVVTEYSSDTLVAEMDTVTFGSYPQSDISGNKKDPIEWLVLEKNDNEMLLLSKYILDFKCYNDEGKDVTWETCTLRKWLNDTFYNKAFSGKEKRRIMKSNVVNKDNSECGTSGGNDTNDYVYSLSIDECRQYFGNEDENYYNKRLATKGTEYAKNVDNHGGKLWVSDASEWYGGNSDFWLRSSGDSQDYAADVRPDGRVSTYGYGVDGGDGLRPLLKVKYR